MTVTVRFDNPQIQVTNSSTGIQLSQVILPYSIRDSEDINKYLGGQITLGQSDGIKLTDNTNDWERLGLAKIRDMVADAEIYVPAKKSDAPTSSGSSSDSQATSTTPISASSATNSATSSAASPDK